jgi:hypothetical protein
VHDTVERRDEDVHIPRDLIVNGLVREDHTGQVVAEQVLSDAIQAL